MLESAAYSSLESGDVLTLQKLLLIICMGGVIGGVSDLLRRLDYDNSYFCFNQHKVTFIGLVALVFMYGFLGTAGAIAIQFLLKALGSFSPENTLSNKIFMLSVSVIAGFGAVRILERLTARIERQIEELEEKTEEATEKAEEATHEFRFLTRVMSSLRSEAPESEQKWCIDQVNKHLEKSPDDRTLVILLGRLYRSSGNLEAGIDVLSAFLRKRERIAKRDKDYADVIYNRACYNALLFGQTHEDIYKERALIDLRKSIECSEENRIDAKHDKDFKSIDGDTLFLELVGNDNAPNH